MCELTHPTLKHAGTINDINRQELEQEILCMVYAIWMVSYQKELPRLLGKNREKSVFKIQRENSKETKKMQDVLDSLLLYSL